MPVKYEKIVFNRPTNKNFFGIFLKRLMIKCMIKSLKFRPESKN